MNEAMEMKKILKHTLSKPYKNVVEIRFSNTYH